MDLVYQQNIFGGGNGFLTQNRRTLKNPLTTGKPFLGTKLLRFGVWGGVGALKGLNFALVLVIFLGVYIVQQYEVLYLLMYVPWDCPSHCTFIFV